MTPMLFLHRKLSFVGPVIFALAVPCLTAIAKVDTDRLVPVPADEPIPVSDFFRPRILQNPKLNPSGTHIAAIVSGPDDHTLLMAYDLDSKKIETFGTRGDSDVDMVDWLGDSRLVYRISVKKLASFILCAGEIGALNRSYPLLQNVGASLIAIPPKDRAHPLVRLAANTMNTGRYGEVVTANANISTGKLLDLSGDGFLVDPHALDETVETNVRHISKRHPVLKTPDGFDQFYLADKDGQLSFGVTSTNGILTLNRLADDKWEKCPENLEEIEVLGCGDNPGEIVVLGPRRDGKPRPLEIMEGATGKVIEVLVQDSAYDCNASLYRDPTTHNIVGVSYMRKGPHFVWFVEAYRNLQKLVNGMFPGQIVRILGTDEAGKMVLVSSFSDRQPAVYSWVDLEKHTGGLIKSSRPWIDPKRMQAMNVIKYKTRDGRELDAYLTLPAGASKQKPPALVVLPGEDVWARNYEEFDSEAQFLASRGYAVLRPNTRGSRGFTWMFPIEDEWAFRKMHEDVTDATKTVVASGLVDRNRVAIMGTSFGGFLALSGVAYEPSLYHCAVAVSAVYDWGKLITDYKYNQYTSAYYSRMVYKLGEPKNDPEKWDAIAPVRHAEQIRVPILISRSEYDAPVAIKDSKDLAATLEKNHVPVESISFLNEADGVNHLSRKVELYTRIEAFLAKYLAPN